MCFFPPKPPKSPRDPHIPKVDKTSTAVTRIHCSHESSFPSTSAMPHYLSKQQHPSHKPSKTHTPLPPTYTVMYSAPYPYPNQVHPSRWGISTPSTYPPPKSQSQVDYENAKEDALLRDLDQRKQQQLDDGWKRAHERFQAQVNEQLDFSESLRKRFVPPRESGAKAAAEFTKQETDRKEERRRERDRERLAKYEKDEEEREWEQQVKSVKGALQGQIGDLKRAIEEGARKNDLAEAKSEGIRLGEEKSRRGRDSRRSRSRSSIRLGEEESRKGRDSRRSRSRSSSRSRSRSRHGERRARGGAIGYGGSGWSVSDPNAMGLLGAPYGTDLAAPTNAQMQMQHNPTGLLAHQNAYAFNHNQAPGLSSSDPSSTYLLDQTARTTHHLSSKINRLEDGQKNILGRFESLNGKLDSQEQQAQGRHYAMLNSLANVAMPRTRAQGYNRSPPLTSYTLTPTW